MHTRTRMCPRMRALRQVTKKGEKTPKTITTTINPTNLTMDTQKLQILQDIKTSIKKAVDIAIRNISTQLERSVRTFFDGSLDITDSNGKTLHLRCVSEPHPKYKEIPIRKLVISAGTDDSEDVPITNLPYDEFIKIGTAIMNAVNKIPDDKD